MNSRQQPDFVEHLRGAGLRLAADEAAAAQGERQRMLAALDAARAIQRAIAEGVIAVRFAAFRNDDADPLDLEICLSIGRDTRQDADVCPAFTFNLRDAYVAGTKDGADAEAVDRAARIAPDLENLVAQMRRNIRGVYRAAPRQTGEVAEVGEVPRPLLP